MIRTCRILNGIIISLLCCFIQGRAALSGELDSRNSFSSLVTSCAVPENEIDYSDTTISGYESESLNNKNLKDPALAFGYSVMPGILLHGSGNFYAGNRKIGTVFLVSGLWCLAGYIVNNMGPWYDEPGYSPPQSDNSHSRAQMCLLFYFVIWGADMITAPVSCRRYNKKITENNLSLAPYMRRNGECRHMGIRLQCRF